MGDSVATAARPTASLHLERFARPGVTPMRLLGTVTFNSNQLRAHLIPLLGIDEVERIVMVADHVDPDLVDHPKLEFRVPTKRQQRLLGRAGAKTLLCRQVARELRPDWVISWNIMPHGVNGFLAARSIRARSMYHMIGGHEEWAGGGVNSDNAILSRLPRPVPALERAFLRVIRSSTLVGTMGSSGRDRLIAEGMSADRVVITPASIDCERFSPAPVDQDPVYDVITVGQLIDRKRQIDLLEAVAQLRLDRPNIRAAIVGEGPLRGELEQAARRLGVDGAVEFLGGRKDVEALYRSARVFCLTSRFEGLSVALMEAMACGLPAVVARAGDLADLVHDERNGAVVPIGDGTALTKALGHLLDNEDARRQMGHTARGDVLEYSSVEVMTARYRRMLLGLPGEWGPRPIVPI